MASIVMTTARSQATDPRAAAEALVRGLGAPPRLAVMFASSDRDQRALNAAVRARLPATTRLIGATTAGEIDHEGLHTGSVVLAGLAGDFEVGLGLGQHLSEAPVEAGAAAMAQACAELGTPPEDLDTERCVGLVIDDGFRYKKEELLIGMLDRNPDLVLVGGGASNTIFDPSAAQTHVHVDGEVATDAALVALFRTDAPWAALRSHWYEPTGQTLTITKVDDSCTRALEIDGQPAARRYAELLGVSVDELEFGRPRGFSERPTGVRVGREIFLRSPWKPLPDGSILFANMLDEGAELELMRRVDMVQSTHEFFTVELPRRVRSPTATLLFHCGGRMWTAHSHGIVDRLSQAFTAAPTPAGMNVCFELFRGFAINTTLTALAFGDSDPRASS
ncbi:FIST C-terminal domain-containing protein [Nannocystis sp. ILAH1]|uniref:FIST signal transduction protein n=1 Tax=unclassified Nannocystis TaxID=2627009 RepID=UPI00226EF713|nr:MULTISPECIES: FIST N-terminal domain-containing protein [unclassified Nannocystis]MCY0994011.1 FIST C-terminal domain-containing protein [Nannocystis sp. ILAH1]MCY1066977.1 FIST C-terminal domain-containing protein [Nannocystis sp. RBIL2]